MKNSKHSSSRQWILSANALVLAIIILLISPQVANAQLLSQDAINALENGTGIPTLGGREPRKNIDCSGGQLKLDSAITSHFTELQKKIKDDQTETTRLQTAVRDAAGNPQAAAAARTALDNHNRTATANREAYNSSRLRKRIDLCIQYHGGTPIGSDKEVKGEIKKIEDYKNSVKPPICDTLYTPQTSGQIDPPITTTQAPEQKKITDAQAHCKEIYELRLEGNTKYAAFKEVEFIYKDCLITSQGTDAATGARTGTELEACKDKKTALDTASRDLNQTLLEIAQKEQLKAAGETFNASGFFKVDGQVQNTTIISVGNKLADWMLTLLATVATVALIIGGGMMLLSGANEELLNQGKEIFTLTLLGITLVLLAYAIVSFIQNVVYNV